MDMHLEQMDVPAAGQIMVYGEQVRVGVVHAVSLVVRQKPLSTELPMHPLHRHKYIVHRPMEMAATMVTKAMVIAMQDHHVVAIHPVTLLLHSIVLHLPRQVVEQLPPVEQVVRAVDLKYFSFEHRLEL